MTNAQLNRILDRYVADLISYYPSPPQPGMPRGGGTNQLERLLRRAKDSESPMRHCQPVHVRVLMARFAGVYWEQGESKTFDETQDVVMVPRAPTSREVARTLNMTWDRYRRVMTEARKLVRRALAERKAA